MALGEWRRSGHSAAQALGTALHLTEVLAEPRPVGVEELGPLLAGGLGRMPA